MTADPSTGRLPADLAEAFGAAGDRFGRLAGRVLYFPSVGSTNAVAAALAATGNSEGVIVIADEQTAGRGRRGHSWFSPPGCGLYVSVVLRPARARADRERATGLVTLAAGVALAEAIEARTGLRADIKWPNDLLAGGRKLCGILAEAVSGSSAIEAVVLGYGINVGPMICPPDLADRATSLESELGRSVDRAALCVETLVTLSRRYEDLLEGRFDGILDAWRARAPSSRGVPVTWTTPGGRQTGITAGIDERGALLVRCGDSIERIVAAELTWV